MLAEVIASSVMIAKFKHVEWKENAPSQHYVINDKIMHINIPVSDFHDAKDACADSTACTIPLVKINSIVPHDSAHHANIPLRALSNCNYRMHTGLIGVFNARSDNNRFLLVAQREWPLTIMQHKIPQKCMSHSSHTRVDNICPANKILSTTM